MLDAPKIAWLIPCLNEESTIAKVIEDIKVHCPEGAIYVFDNRSTDQTAAIARSHGVEVVSVLRRGKGHVVRRMFEVVDADIYLLIDGDDTYDVAMWRHLVEPVVNGEADMSVAARLSLFQQGAFRSLHLLGNYVISGAIRNVFRVPVFDALSGYRCFSRIFAKGAAINAKGFEIETELTIYSCENRMTIVEVPLPYKSRPVGSFSKLKTFHDGFLIGYMILRMIKDYKPLTFFGALGLSCGAISVLLHHYADNPPGTLIFGFAAMVSVATGIILNAIAQRAKEVSQLVRKSLVKPPSDSAHRDHLKSVS